MISENVKKEESHSNVKKVKIVKYFTQKEMGMVTTIKIKIKMKIKQK